MSPDPEGRPIVAINRQGSHTMLRAWAIGHRVIVPTFLFALYFHLSILNPENVGWLLHGDLGQHFLGWTAFRFDEWRWPLAISNLIAYPEGAPLSATDSNPLVSILLKPFSSVLPTYFQYVGIWYLACLIISYNIVFNLLVFLTERPWSSVLGAVMVVASSFYFWRLEHNTLMAHWLIFGALSVFVRPKSDRSAVAKHAGILGLAVAIHPYFVPMTFPIAGMDLLRRAHRRYVDSRSYLQASRFLFAGLCIFLAMIAAVAMVCGMFTLAVSPQAIGIFTMDPLAWLNGNPSSYFLPGWTVGGGQYEGAQYLGLGALISIILALVLWMTGKASVPEPLAKSIPWLIPAMIILYLMAISPVIRIFGETIVDIDLSDWPVVGFILNRFRSSGRLAWPVSYILVLVSVTLLLSFRSRMMAPVLVILVTLQFIDLSPVLQRTHTVTSPPESDVGKAQRTGDWRRIVDGAERVHFSRGVDTQTYFDIAYWAFPQGKSVNRFYYAQGLTTRAQKRAEEEEHRNFRQGDLAQDALYVLRAADLARVLVNETVQPGRVQLFDEYYVIGAHTTDAKYQLPFSIDLQQDNGSLPELFENCVRDCALILSVKDEASQNLPDEYADLISRAGGDISGLGYRSSYAAIIKDGTLIEQAISADAEVTLSADLFGIGVETVSGGLVSTNTSSIRINGLEVSPDLRGINVVRLEPQGVTAINAFDTFVSPTYVQIP